MFLGQRKIEADKENIITIRKETKKFCGYISKKSLFVSIYDWCGCVTCQERKREDEKSASSELVEQLQTQTTNLGLQLLKQMDNNIGS